MRLNLNVSPVIKSCKSSSSKSSFAGWLLPPWLPSDEHHQTTHSSKVPSSSRRNENYLFALPSLSSLLFPSGTHFPESPSKCPLAWRGPGLVRRSFLKQALDKRRGWSNRFRLFSIYPRVTRKRKEWLGGGLGGRKKGVWDNLASCQKGPEKKYCKVVESTVSGGLLSHQSSTSS